MKKFILIAVLSVFLLTGCPESDIVDYSEIGWKQLDFPNSELKLTSVYFKDTLTGWVAAALFKPYETTGNYASIYYTDDGGKTWTEQLRIDTNYFYEISFWTDNHGYALAQDGFLFETKDGGLNWQQRPLIINNNVTIKNSLRDIFFQNDNVAWIAGAYGTLLKTTDQGNTWEKLYVDSASHFLGIHFFDDNKGILIGGEDYVGNTDARVLITSDGGESWTTSLFVEGKFCRDADYNGDEVIIVGLEGLVAKSIDKGNNWELIDIGAEYPLNAVAWQSNSRIWIAGYFGQFYWSDDKGNTWEKYDTGNNVNYYDVKFLDELHGWLVGHFGAILYTNNGGKDIVLE